MTMQSAKMQSASDIPREKLPYLSFGPWERIVLEEDERHRSQRCGHAVIIFVMRGRVTVFVGDGVRQILKKGQIMLIPAKAPYLVHAHELSRFVTCLCDDHLKCHPVVGEACRAAAILPRPLATNVKILTTDEKLIEHIALVEIYLRVGMGADKPQEHQDKLYGGLQDRLLDHLARITKPVDMAIFFYPAAMPPAGVNVS